jgi:hypothetical protein
MLVLDVGTGLHTPTWVRAVRGAAGYTRQAGGWTDEARGGILIDLSRVEFADFVALGQVAQLVEGAARNGIPVRVALPLQRARTAELAWLERTRRSPRPTFDAELGLEARIRGRAEAYRFMVHSGFADALVLPHLPEARVEVTRGWDATGEAAVEPFESLELTRATRARSTQAIFPLRWVQTASADERWLVDAASILTAAGSALSDQEAEGFTRILLLELVENVFQHARESEQVPAPAALIGAVSFNLGGAFRPRVRKFPPRLQPYLEAMTEAGKPFVRVVVADSGIGIPRTLDPVFTDRHRIHLRAIEETLGELRRSEQLLFWSLSPSSSRSPRDPLGPLRPRGLARVERFTKAYQGALLLAAEDAWVGHTYLDRRAAPLRNPMKRSGALLPGTLVEVLLTERARVGRRARRPGETGARVVVARLDLDRSGNGFADGVVPSELDGEIDCVAVLAGRVAATRDGPAALAEAVRRAHESIHMLDAGLAVVLTENGEEVTSTLGAFDHAREDEVVEEAASGGVAALELAVFIDEPVMVVDREGTVMWFGATSEMRGYLYDLADRVLAPADVVQQGMTPQLLADELPEWVGLSEDGAAYARVTAADVFGAVITATAVKLEVEVADGRSAHVQEGRFWSPTLQPISRWIRPTELTRTSVGLPVAAFALARALTVIAEPELLRHARVVSAGGADTIAAAVRAALGAHRGVDRPSHLRVRSSWLYEREVRPQVVIVADLVLTENTVRHVLVDLMRTGEDAVAVCCLFDAREERAPTIDCFGKAIPIIGLANVNVRLAGDSPDRFIHPVTQAIVDAEREAEDEYSIATEDLLAALGNGNSLPALFLGHIARGTARHFTAYLRAARLIDENAPTREPILDAFAREAGRLGGALVDSGGPVPLEIWHPEENGPASVIADAVATRLNSGGRLRVTEVRSIERSAFSGSWIFTPGRVDTPAGTHVLIVDWGAATGATLHQALGIAADSGAASVQALVMTSQLLPADETAVRKVRMLAGRTSTVGAADEHGQMALERGRDGGVARDVPVDVHFLTRLRVGISEPELCRLCALGAFFASEATHAPTRLLRNHAAAVALELAPVSVETLGHEPPQDLYGVNVSPSEVSAVLALRALLERSVTSGHARLELRTQLDDWREHRRPAAFALLRLLTLEPAWLKRDPLRLTEFRRLVADLATSIASAPAYSSRGGEQGHVADGVRRQAIIVLRMSSKRRFLDEFPPLLARWARRPELAGDLLFGMYTYVGRSYHRTEPTVSRAWHSLVSAQEMLGSVQSVPPDVATTVAALLREVEGRRLAMGYAQSPMEAWRALRLNYVQPLLEHHRVMTPAVALKSELTGVPAERAAAAGETLTAEEWAIQREAWRECAEFFATHLLPHLQPVAGYLVDALNDLVYEGSLSSYDYARWTALLAQPSTYPLQRLDEILEHYERAPDAFDVTAQKEVAEEVGWWYDHLFNPPKTGGKAPLFRILAHCPCYVDDQLRAALARVGAAELPFHLTDQARGNIPHVEVFCRDTLLLDAFAHVIANATEERRRVRGADPPQLDFHHAIDEEYVVVTIRNTNTRETHPAGRGMVMLNSRLQAYGAQITPRPVKEPWTFAAAIRLRLWNA